MRRTSFLPAVAAITFLIFTAATILAMPAQANNRNNDKAANAASTDEHSYSYARIVRLSLAEGDVQIVRPTDSSKWEPAVANMPLQQGFALGTNDGRAEIEFEHGGMMWLASNSVAQFTELALSDGGRITQISLSQGTASFAANLAVGDSFLVTTPKLQIRATGTAEFRVDSFNDGASVSDIKGKVSVTSLAAPVAPEDLAKGQTFAVNSGAKNLSAASAIRPNPASDSWDKWVTGRLNAEVYGETQSAGYANAPVSYGLADLSMFGNWNYFPGFGYGWQPFGMNAGWAPFMDGQWMFYSGMGWTWISDEPWGWMPYHFGSWGFSPTYGYIWMPDGYGFWNPAPVQWVSAGGRLGWRPLGTSSGSTAMPVIVGTKTIGKFGRNQVFNNAREKGPVQVLAGAPLSNGKIASSEALPGMPSRMIQSRPRRNVQAGAASFAVPTARTLRAMPAVAPLRALPPPAPGAPMARPLNAMSAVRPPAMNAMPAAPRNLPAPPPRSFSSPSGFNRPAYSGASSASSSSGSSRYSAPQVSTPRASAPPPPSAPAPAPASHPAPAARPH